MHRAVTSLLLLGLAGCPPVADPGAPVFFTPGVPIDLGRRPLARIASPVIVARDDDVTLTGTAFFYVVESICDEWGCTQVVAERAEPLCVALRGAQRCEHGVVPHTPAEVPAGAVSFFGRFNHRLEVGPGFAVPGLAVGAVSAHGEVDEGFKGLPGSEGDDERLELVIVGEGDAATLDVAPEGAAPTETLGGFDTDDGAGLMLVRRDGQLVALDTATTATTGGLVGAAVGDVYLDSWGGRNVAGAPVGREVVVVRMTATDQFDPLELAIPGTPMRLFFELLPGAETSPAPLRPFRLVRASTPTPASLRLCFNRRLDPDSLEALTVTSPEIETRGAATLLIGGQCVLIQTTAQAPLAGLTVTASGALTSASGEVLDASTVGVQAPPRRVESVTRLFPGLDVAIGVDPSLEPQGDGTVRVVGGSLLDPSFLQILDEGALPEGSFRPELPTTLLPDRTGLWVIVDDGVALVDGLDVTRHATPTPIGRLHPLEGGAIAFGVSGGAVHVAVDGTVTQLPVSALAPTFEAPVIDGAGEALWVNENTLEHVLLDGDGVELLRFTRPSRFLWAARSGGRLFAVDDRDGLVVVDTSTGAVAVAIAGLTFGGWSRLEDGGLELYLVRLSLGSPVLRLRDGVITALAIPDPDGIDTSSYGRARIVGEHVFVHGFRHTATHQSHLQLRVMHKDTWAALEQGAEEAP